MNRSRRDDAVIALAIATVVIAWLLWPRVGHSSYESPPRELDTSYVWPQVERTITTVVVVQPEDLDRDR